MFLVPLNIWRAHPAVGLFVKNSHMAALRPAISGDIHIMDVCFIRRSRRDEVLASPRLIREDTIRMYHNKL
jgi:hypothetical protein